MGNSVSSHPLVQDHNNTTANTSWDKEKSGGATGDFFNTIDHLLTQPWIAGFAVTAVTDVFMFTSFILYALLEIFKEIGVVRQVKTA